MAVLLDLDLEHFQSQPFPYNYNNNGPPLEEEPPFSKSSSYRSRSTSDDESNDGETSNAVAQKQSPKQEQDGSCSPVASADDDIDGEALSCKHTKNSRIFHVRSIRQKMIPRGSRVVFDWDNTLKLVDRGLRTLVNRVSVKLLQMLKHEKNCELFIISAIRPSQLNIDTLLMEVDRLGLTDVFCPSSIRTSFGKRKEVRREGYHWLQEGNIIICGYDKAEVFKAVVEDQSGEEVTSRPVVFFDDEKVNIDNFSNIIQGSLCFHIEGTDRCPEEFCVTK